MTYPVFTIGPCPEPGCSRMHGVSALRPTPDDFAELGGSPSEDVSGVARSADGTLLAGAGSLPTVPVHPAAPRLTPLASGQWGADAPVLGET